MFYATIRTPPQLMASHGTLDALGIRYVLALHNERMPDTLLRRGTIAEGDGYDLTLYENPDAAPGAFLVDAAAEWIPRMRFPGCENDRLLCTDLTRLGERRLDEYVTVIMSNGTADVSWPAADQPRLLVVSQMFRPDWKASSAGRRLQVVPIAGALLGVRVPPGVSAVQLRYRPLPLMIAYAIACSTIAAAFLVLITAAVMRRASVSSGAVPRGPARHP
jgi:hypothetical protein